MNCYLNFQHSAGVPTSTPPEVSKAASEPALQQCINSRSAEQQTTFFTHAQARAAFVSAQRHMSPVLLNRATPQVGPSTILLPRFFCPSTVNVGGSHHQELQRQQPQIQHSREQHETRQNLQPSKPPQQQHYQQESSQKELAKNCGVEHHTTCKLVNAADPKYKEQEQRGIFLTASGARSQHTQQLLCPATTLKFLPCTQQQQKLKNDFMKSNAADERTTYAHQAQQPASRWGNIFHSAHGATGTAAGPCGSSTTNSAAHSGTFPSSLEQRGSPSFCRPQVPRVAAPDFGVRASPSQPRSFSGVTRGSSTGNGVTILDKRAVLHFSNSNASREDRHGGARPVASPSFNGHLRPSILPTPEAVIPGPAAAAAGVERPIPTGGDTTLMVPPLAGIASTAGGTAGGKAASTPADAGPGQPGNALFSLSPWSSAPQQQAGVNAPHLAAKGFERFMIGNNGAAPLPVLRGGESTQQYSRGLHCRLPVDTALPNVYTATTGTQLHNGAPHLLRTDTERRDAEETKSLIDSCSTDLPQVVERSPDAEQHQRHSSKQWSNVCDSYGQSQKADNVDLCTVTQCVAGEVPLSTAAQQTAGFALGRPRTPPRLGVPETQQHWQSPSQQQAPQAQEKARGYSALQMQLRLQQQLRQLQDQHPYSWAGVRVPAALGSPVLVPGTVPKLPFGAGLIYPEKRAQTSILPNALISCCWQPHSPRASRVGPTSPSTCSNGTSVARNQVNWVLSADGTTYIRVHEQDRGLQNTSINMLQRRPTSAPPGKNDLRPPHPCTVVQSHQQRTLASTGSVLANRRGLPWKYQSHLVLQQRNEHRDVSVPPVPQPSPLTAAAPHLTSSPAFSIGPSEAASAAAAAAVAAASAEGHASGSSASTSDAPRSHLSEDGEHGPAWKEPRHVVSAETRATDLRGHTIAERGYEAPMPPGVSGTDVLLPPGDTTSASVATATATRNATGMVQKRSVPRSVDNNTFLGSASSRTDRAGVAVPLHSKPRYTGGKQLHSSGSTPFFPPCDTPEEKGVSMLLSMQNDAGVVEVGGTVCERATPQQHQQSLGITVSQIEVPAPTIGVKTSREHRQEGQTYEAKAAHADAALTAESATCTSGTQLQEPLGVQQKYRKQRQHPSDSLRKHALQHEKWQPQQKQKHSQSQQQQEQRSQTWGVQHDPLRIVSVAPGTDETSSRAGILQQKEFADGLETKDTELHTRTQAASVVRREDVLHKEGPISSNVGKHHNIEFAESSAPFCLNTLDISISKGDTITDNALLRSPGDAYTSASHSTTQDSTVGALGAARRYAGSDCTSERVSVNAIVTGESSGVVRAPSDRAQAPVVSATEDGHVSEVDAEPSRQHWHDQQAVPALSKDSAGRGNIAGEPVVRSAEVDARTNQSTAGSERSGVGSGRRDAGERCSQEGTFSGTSSCRHTSSSRSSTRMSCQFRVHDFSALPEATTDDNRETCANESGTSASSQSKRRKPSCNTAHAGNQNIGSGGACSATAGNVRARGIGEGGTQTQKRARGSCGSSQRECPGHLERKVERNRMCSISSTDVSRCTGRSTTNSNENLAVSEEGVIDVANEGQEDVIPLPSFLWRSPLSLLRSGTDSHFLRSGTASTTTEAESFCRPGCRRSSLQCGGPFQNDKAHKAAEAIGNSGNSYLIQRDFPGASNSTNKADMQLGDFELADPRFGGEASLLGRGTYGVVRLMRHKPTGRLYAVKSIEKSSVVEAGMVSQVEFELLTQKDVLRHRNVLRCHAFLEDIDRVHMILEYCSGGDLYTRIRTQPLRRISEQEAFLYFAQLVNGLHYMHTRCIMHRDLKLENLLLDKDGVLKIADLGWCTTILGKRRNFNFCGTLDYLAPEMIRGDGHDWRVDLWGAGILLYEMLDGKPPFQSTRHLELVQQILKAKINLPPHIPPDAGNLIEQLLQYDPEDRIPLHAICQHPWVKRMWGELKRHYYSVYPNAIPAAFDLCSSGSTDDTLSLASGNRKMLLDLREIYPIESARMPPREDDDNTRSRKAVKSPHSADVSSPVAAPGTSHGSETAPSTAADGVDANSLSSHLATTGGAAAATSYPSEMAAGADLTEVDCGSVVPTAQDTVAHLSGQDNRMTLESGAPEKRGRSSTSNSRNTASLERQNRRRVSARLATSTQKESHHDRVFQRAQESDACVANEEDAYVVESSGTNERGSRGSPSSVEHQEQETIRNPDTAGCITTAKAVCDRQTGFQHFAGGAGAGKKKSCTSLATGTSAITSPASLGGEISAAPAAGSAMEHSNTPSATALQPRLPASRSPAPAAAAAGALPRLRAGIPPATGATAAARRRTTATAASIREAVQAATSGDLASRAADKSPRSTSVEGERSLSFDKSLPHMQIKAKRFGVPRRPRVNHPISKIDSGLGSQKQILLSPPMKRSALRAREPWDGSTSSVGDTEQTELNVAESFKASADENGQNGSSPCTAEDLKRPTLYGGLQEPTALTLRQQHLSRMQRPVQQEQQMQHRHEQLLPGLESIDRNLLPLEKMATHGQTQQQLLTHDEERLQQSRQLEHRSQVKNQWNVEQQQFLRCVYGSENDSGTLHQSPPPPDLQQRHLTTGLSCNPTNVPVAATGTNPLHESMEMFHHQLQHLQHKGRTQRSQALSEQQALSPRHNHQLQHQPLENALPQNGTIFQEPSHPWTAWYLLAQQQHMREQQWLPPAQKHAGTEQQVVSYHSFPQDVSPHRLLIDHQQRILHQQPQTLNRIQHVQQQRPTHEKPHGEQQRPIQSHLEYHQHHLQRHRLHQDNHLLSKEVVVDAVGSSLQPHSVATRSHQLNAVGSSLQPHSVATLSHQAGPAQQSLGQQHYALGYKQHRVRSMTPPASFDMHRLRNPSNSVHVRSYHQLPHPHNLRWLPQAAEGTQVHSESRIVSFHNTTAAEEQPQGDGGEVASPAFRVDNSVTSQATDGQMQSNSLDSAGDAASTSAADTLHPIHTVVPPDEDNSQISYANLVTCAAETSNGEDKRHSLCAPCGAVAHAAGDSAFEYRAETATVRPEATSAQTGTVNRQQVTSPQQVSVDQNALHAYTPRWGRSRHAAAHRSATVAPPSLLSPLASATRVRRLLAVSAPPRSCGVAAAVRKHPRGSPFPENSEEHRQHRHQVQQLRQQMRAGTPPCSQAQQQRRLDQREAAAFVSSPVSGPETQQSKKENLLRASGIEADDATRTERLSCFSFGNRRGMNRHQHGESTGNNELALFSDRLSVGSVHDVGLLSQRLNIPDSDRGGPSPFVPSAKARLVLNKLFENSTPPRQAKAAGARLVARTPAARMRPARDAVAARASTVTSVIESRASAAKAALPTLGSTIGMSAKASSPSPKAVCRFRQVSNRSRFHAPSPSPCGTATAAVAAAAAAWRARAAERESRERKASAETSLRVGKIVGNCPRQGVCTTDNTGHGSQDIISRKTGITQAQGRFDMLGRSRVATHGLDAARKTQRLFDLSPQKGISTCPPKNPQPRGAAGKQRYGAGDRAVAKGTYPEYESTAPLRTPATSPVEAFPVATPPVSVTPKDEPAETNAPMHAFWSNGDTYSSNNADSNNSCITSSINSQAGVTDAALASETSGEERSVWRSTLLHESVPQEMIAHLLQQGGPLGVTPAGTSGSNGADSCTDQLTCRSIPKTGPQPCSPNVEETCKLGSETGFVAASSHDKQSVAAVLSHEERAQGSPSFPASKHSANNFMSSFSTSPPTSTSPTKCINPPSVFVNGQASNTTPSLPGYQFATAAAVAAAAAQQVQRSLDRRFVCQRSWSPPCRDATATPWGSSSSSNSTSERAFFSRQPMPLPVGNYAISPHAPNVASIRTHNYPPAGLQQVDSALSTGGASGSSLTSSWLARERQLYTTRQQTPPPAAMSVAVRGMRQATPLCSGMLGSPQHSYHALKAQGPPSVGSVSGHVSTPPIPTAAMRRLDYPRSPSRFWGSAAIAGMSAAASTAACHARLGPAHAHSGNRCVKREFTDLSGASWKPQDD